MDPITKFTGGRESVRTRLNQLVETANAVNRMRGDGRISVNHGSNSILLQMQPGAIPAGKDPVEGTWLCQVTSVDSGMGGGIYNGVIIEKLESAYNPFDPTVDLTYTTGAGDTRPCYIVNRAEQDTTTHTIPIDRYVRGVLVCLVPDSTYGLIPVFEVNEPLGPKGTDQYQVYQMLSDDEAGWDWVRAHD